MNHLKKDNTPITSRQEGRKINLYWKEHINKYIKLHKKQIKVRQNIWINKDKKYISVTENRSYLGLHYYRRIRDDVTIVNNFKTTVSACNRTTFRGCHQNRELFSVKLNKENQTLQLHEK